MGLMLAIWWLWFVPPNKRGRVPHSIYPAIFFLFIALYHWYGRRFGMVYLNCAGAFASMCCAWAVRLICGVWR